MSIIPDQIKEIPRSNSHTYLQEEFRPEALLSPPTASHEYDTITSSKNNPKTKIISQSIITKYIYSALVAIVFLPIWAISSLLIWLSKLAKSPDPILPLEIIEALNLIKNTQQLKSDNRPEESVNLCFQMFAILTVSESLIFSFKTKETEAFHSTFFPRVQDSESKITDHCYDRAKIQSILLSIWDDLPQNSKLAISNIQKKKPNELNQLENYEQGTIADFFENQDNLATFINSCEDVFRSNIKTNLSPMMEAALNAYLRLADHEPRIAEKFVDLLCITPNKKNKNQHDISESYVIALIKRIWDTETDQFHNDVKAKIEEWADFYLTYYNPQQSFQESPNQELNEAKEDIPLLLKRLKTLRPFFDEEIRKFSDKLKIIEKCYKH
jgi:hypothetical protein